MYGGLIRVSSSEQYVELLSAPPSACSRQMFNAAAGDAAHISHTSIHPFFKTKLPFQVFVEVLLAFSNFSLWLHCCIVERAVFDNPVSMLNSMIQSPAQRTPV